jgi:hypothetical protein
MTTLLTIIGEIVIHLELLIMRRSSHVLLVLIRLIVDRFKDFLIENQDGIMKIIHRLLKSPKEQLDPIKTIRGLLQEFPNDLEDLMNWEKLRRYLKGRHELTNGLTKPENQPSNLDNPTKDPCKPKDQPFVRNHLHTELLEHLETPMEIHQMMITVTIFVPETTDEEYHLIGKDAVILMVASGDLVTQITVETTKGEDSVVALVVVILVVVVLVAEDLEEVVLVILEEVDLEEMENPETRGDLAVMIREDLALETEAPLAPLDLPDLLDLLE